MIATVRRLKINRRYESSLCVWCGEWLAVGDDGAVCEACETPHHVRCWDNQNGCGQSDCINAPLLQDPKVLAEQPAAIETRCSRCSTLLPDETSVCSVCEEVRLADFDGRRYLSDEAYQAFLLGTLSVFVPPVLQLAFYNHYLFAVWVPLVAGVQLGRRAFRKATVGRGQIAADPTLKGTGFTTSAKVLGVTGITLAAGEWLLVLLGIYFPEG